MDQLNEQRSAKRDRRPWKPPEVKTVGTITEIVRSGGTKVSHFNDGSGRGHKDD
jgi:hypothetical protein